MKRKNIAAEENEVIDNLVLRLCPVEESYNLEILRTLFTFCSVVLQLTILLHLLGCF